MTDDIHRAAAAKLFGVPEDKVTPEQRARAKTINYHVIYSKASNIEPDGTPKKWLSEVPETCEFCGGPWHMNVFYDAALYVQGRRVWGLCCNQCFFLSGGQIGQGKGQMYDLQTRVKLDG